MADDSSHQSSNVWPRPKFQFLVRWDSIEMHFEEISGLDSEVQPIAYRDGDSKHWAALSMRLPKYSDVTMKKGLTKGVNSFFEWFKGHNSTALQRKLVTIILFDEKGAPAMVWKLTNARPTKVSGIDLKANGNEVAVETIVFAHEGLTTEAGG